MDLSDVYLSIESDEKEKIAEVEENLVHIKELWKVD